jgi:hypothetical protein
VSGLRPDYRKSGIMLLCTIQPSRVFIFLVVYLLCLFSCTAGSDDEDYVVCGKEKKEICLCLESFEILVLMFPIRNIEVFRTDSECVLNGFIGQDTGIHVSLGHESGDLVFDFYLYNNAQPQSTNNNPQHF